MRSLAGGQPPPGSSEPGALLHRVRCPPPPTRSPERPGRSRGFVSAPHIAADSCHLLCLVTTPRRSPFPVSKPALVTKPGSYFLTTPTPSRMQALPIRQRLSPEHGILLSPCRILQEAGFAVGPGLQAGASEKRRRESPWIQ